MVGQVMPIVRDYIPSMFKDFLLMGCQIAGGFPLYLIGGANEYSDVDIYLNHDWLMIEVVKRLGYIPPSKITSHTAVFNYAGFELQICKPTKRPISDDEMLLMADLSPSACLLRWHGGFEVLALYPDDIKNRICRVLDRHEWTWYRIKQYEAKGYTIV